MDKSDGPFYVTARECERMVSLGATIFQKFTCIACGARQTMPDPNAFYMQGRCDECGVVTDLTKTGCGFMLVASGDPAEHAEFVSVLSEIIASSPAKSRN